MPDTRSHARRGRDIDVERTTSANRQVSDQATFADFWPHYLREHSRPATRALHYVGTSLVIACGVAGLLSGYAALFWAMPVCGYALAWIGHLAVERNRPATFRHPLWSLAADFRMYWLWLSGRLGPELRVAGVDYGPASTKGEDR